MRCPRCGAEYSPLRDSCPKCGAATDSVFDQLDRSGERSPDQLRRNRRAVLGVVAAVLAVTAFSSNFQLFGRHLSIFPGGVRIDTRSDRSEPKEPVTISAADYFDAYHSDSRAADRRFRNREMVVTGEFLRTVPDGYGSIDMRLKTNHPDLPLGIDLDSHSVDAATKLQPGQMVTVSCRGVAGFGDDPWLQDCVIQPPAVASQPEAPGAPTPPPAPAAPQ